jgi:hypothetical protein
MFWTLGGMKNLGNVGVAASTLALTIATLFKIIFEDEDFSAGRAMLIVSYGIVFLIWLFTILLIVVPLRLYGTRYFGSSGYASVLSPSSTFMR